MDLLGIINTLELVGFSQAFAYLLGLQASCAGYGEYFAIMADNDMAVAAVAFGEKIAVIIEGGFKSGLVGAGCPALPYQILLIDGILAASFRSLPFGQSNVGGRFEGSVAQARRQLPLMFEEQIATEILQFVFEMRQVLCRHGFGIDPRPDCMSMTAAFFLMVDHDTGLPFKALRFGNAVCCILEHVHRDTRLHRGIQGNGEIWLLASGAFGNIFDLHERTCHVV
ncbi:hypothetical protein [Cohaesibacter sp. CAU 1516]|uniref:hypothetical protein n=1 Tax=Cohaesibacter sp. CAU 1516 TaxID=2576038 RepID=UPI001FEF5BD3|nr:hypothetical protein [Cohaesibacter sp. CAU 1516]